MSCKLITCLYIFCFVQPLFSDSFTNFATFYTSESCKKEGNSGTLTASGSKFTDSMMICAMPHRNFGGIYSITPVSSNGTPIGKNVVLQHLDYGPGKGPRQRGVVVDVTLAAWKAMNLDPELGKVRVIIKKIKPGG